jgi:hypothetical protein
VRRQHQGEQEIALAHLSRVSLEIQPGGGREDRAQSKWNRRDRLAYCDELPSSGVERFVRDSLLQCRDAELEQISQAVRGPGVEQKAAAPLALFALARVEHGPIDGRLEHQRSLSKPGVGKSADTVLHQELGQPFGVDDGDVIQPACLAASACGVEAACMSGS